MSSTALAIEQRLSRQAAHFYYSLSVVKPYHLTAGIFNYRVDDIFTSQMPVKILVGFVTSAAYNGELTSSPFYFNPSDRIESIEFFKNGIRTGLQRTMPIDVTANTVNLHTAYRELTNAVTGSNSEKSLPFSLSQYRLGYFFYGLDLTSDGFDNSPHRYPVEQGSISVHVKFRQALQAALQMVVYATFQETMSVNRSRAIVTTVNV